MIDAQTFDSRSTHFKSHYGAVPTGTAVTFTLRPPRSEGWSRGMLTARFEFEADRRVEIPLRWVGTELGQDSFQATLDVGHSQGLIWYSLRLERLDGRGDSTGELQLTVYDGEESVPSWFGEGMSYQIFPDRFRRTRVPESRGMPGDRWVHQGWEEEPEYRPDQHGEVRNRDFFGGDLNGVREKLPYLKGLGVETLYFCPIFEAPENHRYGTGDYERIDPMLGTEEDFTAMCAEAHALGMRVMLDGVFNHTAFVSKYFNGDGSYPNAGARQGKESPYYDWFYWQRWPDKYASWWGIYSMPTTNKHNEQWLDYITGENGIIRRWLRAGADGWRLDVADELPDSMVHAIHAAARAEKSDAVVVGEVWEDGSNKIAYSVRRRHILGGHCDGLMNYPFRNALLDYLLGVDAAHFRDAMEVLRENYPPFAFYSAMNSMGTHDTLRVLTQLGVGSSKIECPKAWRADYRMGPEERGRGIARLRLGALILFSFPGSPTVYYGDEAGMEGFEDPFNRQTFPWGHEDLELTAWFTALGKARGTLAPLRRGNLSYVRAEDRVLAFTRHLNGETVLCAVNAGDVEEIVTLPWEGTAVNCLGDGLFHAQDGVLNVTLPPMSGQLLRNSSHQQE